MPALAIAAALVGCGTHTPSVLLALDGPPLALIVRNDSATWKGAMERGCMAGVGHISLRKINGYAVCTGDVDHPATDKGRLYADLACSDGTAMTFVYRNLGPDQGMGLARVSATGTDEGDGKQAVLFYHPSEEEAERRLARIREDIARAVALKQKRDEAENAAATP